jgi:hypothetical protein
MASTARIRRCSHKRHDRLSTHAERGALQRGGLGLEAPGGVDHLSLILRILGDLDEHAVTNIMVLGNTLEQGPVEENFGELTSDMVFDFALCGEQAEVVTAVDKGACFCLFRTVVA